MTLSRSLSARLARLARLALALLVVLAAGGAAADGSTVVVSHQGDENPLVSEGWGFQIFGGDLAEVLASIAFQGIADDQGLPVWEIDDAGTSVGLSYTAGVPPEAMEDALAAGFVLRARVRIPPQAAGVAAIDGMAGIALGSDLALQLGSNAAPPAGDGNLRLLLVGGPPEVVIPGGSVHHLIEAAYDPVAGSLDVLVDGASVISDWPWLAGGGSEVRFGTLDDDRVGGTGRLRTHLVELAVATPDCEDGLDNDGDGLVDAEDPGCTPFPDDSEEDDFACNDGEDDDGDGLVDLADPGCASRRDEIEFDVGPGATAWIAEARLRVEPDVNAGWPALELSSVGLARLQSGPGGTPFLQFPAIAGSTQATVPATFTASVRLTADLPAGTLALSTGIPANTHPLRGELRICFIDPSCLYDFSTPFQTSHHTLAGLGGLWTAGGSSIDVSFDYAPWAFGTASALVGTQDPGTATTRQGFAHGPLSATSTAHQTSGVIQLVTPMQGRSIGVPGTRYVARFASLRVQLVPEPARALMLCAGALLLLALGWRHRRT